MIATFVFPVAFANVRGNVLPCLGINIPGELPGLATAWAAVPGAASLVWFQYKFVVCGGHCSKVLAKVACLTCLTCLMGFKQLIIRVLIRQILLPNLA
jgi:hypothetical protein